MGWRWLNMFVCPHCGGEVAELYTKRYNGQQYSIYKCLNKKCLWMGRKPGEIHGRVYE